MRSLILIILLFLPINTACGKILITYSIDSPVVTELLKTIDSSALILVNIDDTVLTPKSKIFKYDSPYQSFIDTIANLSKKKPIFKNALSVWMTHRKLMLVEENWPQFITTLKNSGATVVGLVQMDPQVHAVLKEPELFRYKEVQQFNINFTDKIYNQELFKINSIGGKNAIFYKGIIFTGLFSKAQILVDFMKVTSNIPKKIILFDNNIDNIKQIETFLRTYDIECYFVHYLGTNNLSGMPEKNVFQLQQRKLIDEGIWLEDEEAEQYTR